MLQALLLDIQRTTFSNFSFRWDQVTSGLTVLSRTAQAADRPDVDD